MFISSTDKGVVTCTTCNETWRINGRGEERDRDREESIRAHRGLRCGSAQARR